MWGAGITEVSRESGIQAFIYLWWSGEAFIVVVQSLSCVSLRPHGLQHARLLCPPLSPRKWKWSHSVMSDSLRPHGLWLIRLLRPCDFPGKSAGVDCHFLLQGIFPTQELNPGLLHCRQTLYHLSHCWYIPFLQFSKDKWKTENNSLRMQRSQWWIFWWGTKYYGHHLDVGKFFSVEGSKFSRLMKN